MEKKIIYHTRNKHGVRVARCCLSCACKLYTRENVLRQCALDGLCHSCYHICHDWEMSRTIQGAGTSGGKIKRREYLMYAMSVRQREEEMKIDQELCMSIEDIRAEFEKEHGSIYANF